MTRRDALAASNRPDFLRSTRDAAILDCLALGLYEEAGEDPADPVSPVRLAQRLLGRDGVTFVPRTALRTDWAMLTRIAGSPRIVVRRDVPGPELGHTIAHELAHWALRRAGLLDAEVACDYLAAALVAPTQAFRRAVSSLGLRLPELASAFRTTQSLVALRWAESSATPLALVRPGLVRVRNEQEFAWPPDRTVRRWARVAPPRGLARTTLTDDRRRVVLVAGAALSVC